MGPAMAMSSMESHGQSARTMQSLEPEWESKITAVLFKRLYHCCGHMPHKTCELQLPGRQWAHTELVGNDQVPWGIGKHKETSKLQGVAGLPQESHLDFP